MSLRLLFDEQMPKEAVDRLEGRFEVFRVVMLPVLGIGTDDSDIWRFAVQENRVVVTMDTDFLDGEADPGEGTYPGVIFCTDRSPQVINDAIRELGRYYSSADLADRQEPVYVPGRWL